MSTSSPTRMHLEALGQTLRFLVIVQKAGHGDLGVLAATTYAEVLERDQQPEVAELIDRTLSTALTFFVDQLS